jgi:competence ComEA-like helix-hairpin-helix protein
VNTYDRKLYATAEVFNDSLMAQAERAEIAQARHDRCMILWMAFIIIFIAFACQWPETKSIPQPLISMPQKTNELKCTINPNNTSWASLARLPGFGPQKAKTLIEYRQQYKAANNQQEPFSCAEDLQKVKGIGPKTVDKIRKYITFE